VESTGFHVDDLLTAVNYVRVKGGELVDEGRHLLNWTLLPNQIPPRWLEQRLAQSPRGRSTAIEYRRGDGDHPVEVLRRVCDQVHALPENTWLVGHNLLRYDLPLLHEHVARWLPDLELRPPEAFDTGLAEKGLRLKRLPRYGESWPSYLQRIADDRTQGVLWGLEDCVRSYRLTPGVLRHDKSWKPRAIHLLYQRLCWRFWDAGHRIPRDDARNGKS
jgi:hypothetical protein